VLEAQALLGKVLKAAQTQVALAGDLRAVVAQLLKALTLRHHLPSALLVVLVQPPALRVVLLPTLAVAVVAVMVALVALAVLALVALVEVWE
jgi:hypothetical protein